MRCPFLSTPSSGDFTVWLPTTDDGTVTQEIRSFIERAAIPPPPCAGERLEMVAWRGASTRLETRKEGTDES